MSLIPTISMPIDLHLKYIGCTSVIIAWNTQKNFETESDGIDHVYNVFHKESKDTFNYKLTKQVGSSIKSKEFKINGLNPGHFYKFYVESVAIRNRNKKIFAKSPLSDSILVVTNTETFDWNKNRSNCNNSKNNGNNT